MTHDVSYGGRTHANIYMLCLAANRRRHTALSRTVSSTGGAMPGALPSAAVRVLASDDNRVVRRAGGGGGVRRRVRRSSGGERGLVCGAGGGCEQPVLDALAQVPQPQPRVRGEAHELHPVLTEGGVSLQGRAGLGLRCLERGRESLRLRLEPRLQVLEELLLRPPHHLEGPWVGVLEDPPAADTPE